LFVGGDFLLAKQGIPISFDPNALDQIREILGAQPELTDIEFKSCAKEKL
jgi:hypothetical protein